MVDGDSVTFRTCYDLLCREMSLVVELDGHSHDIAAERDIRRDADLKARGYVVLHFTNDGVMDDADAVARAIPAENRRTAPLISLPPAGGTARLASLLASRSRVGSAKQQVHSDPHPPLTPPASGRGTRQRNQTPLPPAGGAVMLAQTLDQHFFRIV